MPIPMVDLGFAISATDTGAGQTYENMKSVVKHIVNSYGLVSIRYGVILFGESATTYIPFSRTFPDEMALLSSLDLPQRLRGEPDLQKALEEAKTMFDQATPRPGARKVLAVIVDNDSSNNKSEIKEAAKVLKDDDIQVIPVGVGPNVDDEELEIMTGNKKNVIKTDKDGDSSSVGEEVIMKIHEGENSAYAFSK